MTSLILPYVAWSAISAEATSAEDGSGSMAFGVVHIAFPDALRLAGELLGLGGDTKACAAAAATAVAVGGRGIGVAYSVGPQSDEEAAPVPGVIKGIVLCGVTGDEAIGVVGAWLASIASALRFNSTLLGLPRFRVSMSMISGSSAAAAAGAAAPPSGPGPPGAGAAAGR